MPSELNAAYLYAQLLEADKINDNRLTSWNLYYSLLKGLKDRGLVELPTVPTDCVHNAHMFYIKVKDINERTAIQEYMKENNIVTTFHYIPLHSAPAGLKFGIFYGEDECTTRESERLLRLPLYYNIEEEDVRTVCELLYSFYNNR